MTGAVGRAHQMTVLSEFRKNGTTKEEENYPLKKRKKKKGKFQIESS